MITSAVEESKRLLLLEDARRAWDGESRANILRMLAVAGFYAIELINYHGLRLGPIEMPQVVDTTFHQEATALAVAWVMVGVFVRLSLLRGLFPITLRFLSTAADLVLLTSMLMIADGPKSPLLVGYFVLLAGSALRLDVSLVQFATVGAIGGYLYVCGYARWFTDRDLRVPRYHQLMFLLALAMTGIILGQVVRQSSRGLGAKEVANP
ncbi:MAG: hypothetical protein U1D30_09315 [Planctomycetota bacterium]